MFILFSCEYHWDNSEEKLFLESMKQPSDNLPTRHTQYLVIYPQLSTSYPQAGGNLGAFGLKLDPVGQLCDLVIDRAALCHQLADFTISVHNRGVVAPAESLANFR